MPSELNKKVKRNTTLKMNLICFTTVLRSPNSFLLDAKTLFILTTFQTMFYALCVPMHILYFAKTISWWKSFLLFLFSFFGFSDCVVVVVIWFVKCHPKHPPTCCFRSRITNRFFCYWNKINWSKFKHILN